MESRWEPADVSAKRQALVAGMVMIPMPKADADFATGGLHRPPVILANFA